jgi:hypothetical protein
VITYAVQNAATAFIDRARNASAGTPTATSGAIVRAR